MSGIQGLPSENAGVVATIDPDAYTTGTQDTDVIDMADYESVMFVVMAGTLGASATLDFKLQSSTATGSGFADITGKSITQLTQAGSDADKQAIINYRGEEAATAGDRYVKGVASLAAQTSDYGVIALGFNPRHGPANNSDLTSVDEIVS